jgi:PAS domain S-box-containing protein
MTTKASIQSLRDSAVAFLASNPSLKAEGKMADPVQLIHELQVHQVEVEMQREHLARALEESEALRKKYQQLYDLAPVGFFSLSRVGEILEVNRGGEKMLGLPYGKLVGRLLQDFFTDKSLTELERLIRTASETEKEVSAKYLLVDRRRTLPLYVNAQAVGTADQITDAFCVRLVLMDTSALVFAQQDVVTSIAKNSGFSGLDS